MSNSELVREAAKWLDRNTTNWAAHINVDTLDISTFDYCILGQLGKADVFKTGLDESYEHLLKAFGMGSFRRPGKGITDAWKREVANRIAQR